MNFLQKKIKGEFLLEKIVPSIFVIISCLILFAVIYQNRNLYLAKFNPNLYKDKYDKSQWMAPNSKTPVSDNLVYAYAGYKYILGLNPILINSEQPPLGKYFVGLSIVTFQNQRAASILVAFLCLVLVFSIVKRATSSFLASSLAVFLTTVTELFINQLIDSPQLDIFQLLFFLGFLFTFLIHTGKKTLLTLVISGLAFGLMLSIKTFYIYFLVFNAWLVLYFLLKKDLLEGIKKLIVLNVTGLVIFISTYLSFFLHGGTIKGFLGVQKYIYSFYSNSTINISKLLGSYISLIFTGHWNYWLVSNHIVKYNGWTVFWPLIFLAGILSIFMLYRKTRDKHYFKFRDVYLLLASFFVVYNLFLFITPIYPRYLLLLFLDINLLIAIYIGTIFYDKKYDNAK